MKRVGALVITWLLFALPAWAIDIAISPGATTQVETNNTITINPVTLNTDLPGFPRGNYSVTFQWHPGANALVPISATRLGGGGTPSGGAVGQEINGVLIEAETFTQDSIGCMLRAQLLNRTGQLKIAVLTYNAFNSAGSGIGYTALYKALSANGRGTAEGWFVDTGGESNIIRRCSQIARYELDSTLSYVSP